MLVNNTAIFGGFSKEYYSKSLQEGNIFVALLNNRPVGATQIWATYNPELTVNII